MKVEVSYRWTGVELARAGRTNLYRFFIRCWATFNLIKLLRFLVTITILPDHLQGEPSKLKRAPYAIRFV